MLRSRFTALPGAFLAGFFPPEQGACRLHCLAVD